MLLIYFPRVFTENNIDCSYLFIMYLYSRNMVHTRSICVTIDSSDYKVDIQESPTYCKSCDWDPYSYIVFSTECICTKQCRRLIYRLTECETRRGSYMGLKNYVIRIHIHKTCRKWAYLPEASKSLRCVHKQILRIYPLENERQCIHLTSAIYLAYYKAR